LLIRSMDRVQKVNPGFETRNLFVFNFDAGPMHLPAERGREFMHSVIQHATAVPGVRAAALATNRPMAGGLLGTILAEGQQADPNQRGTLTALNTVSPEYFDTMRIPLIAGRGFTTFDRDGSARAAIVNQAMARHFWPGRDAIGKRFRITVQNFSWQVVGICGGSVVNTIGEQPQPVAYFPLDQNYQAAMVLITRTVADP